MGGETGWNKPSLPKLGTLKLPLGNGLWRIKCLYLQRSPYRAYPAIYEVLGAKLIVITSLTFQGHVSSSVCSHVTIGFPIGNFLLVVFV